MSDEKNFKERMYDRIRIPLRVLDIIIVLLFVSIVVCVILGMRAK